MRQLQSIHTMSNQEIRKHDRRTHNTSCNCYKLCPSILSTCGKTPIWHIRSAVPFLLYPQIGLYPEILGQILEAFSLFARFSQISLIYVLMFSSNIGDSSRFLTMYRRPHFHSLSYFAYSSCLAFLYTTQNPLFFHTSILFYFVFILFCSNVIFTFSLPTCQPLPNDFFVLTENSWLDLSTSSTHQCYGTTH